MTGGVTLLWLLCFRQWPNFSSRIGVDVAKMKSCRMRTSAEILMEDSIRQFQVTEIRL